jgi:CheY-like chemotaxis protein
MQIFIVEADLVEADRLMHELVRQGFAFQARRIETRAEFLRWLDCQPPDLIFCDHGAPGFSGFAALEIAQEKCPHVPFIFVTAGYDQGLVVEMFDSGAAGYVHKNRLSDLAPVIHQAREEVRQRRLPLMEEVVAEPGVGASRASAEQAGTGSDFCLICSRCKKVRDEWGVWEDLASYLRRHERATVTLALCPACAESEFLVSPAPPSKAPGRFPTPRTLPGPDPGARRSRPSP